jgi:hypothetical protein
MAFNPFSGFRRHQKLLMASVLLLCMITFVLCTGVGGDLSQRLLEIVRPRHGKVWAKLDGHSIYGDDLEALRRQRNLANEFMLRAVRIAMTTADQWVKQETERSQDGKVNPANKGMLGRLYLIKKDLEVRLKRSRYFEGGVKFDDLLDFLLWRYQADRLGVQIDDDTLQEMIFREVFARVPVGGGKYVPLFEGKDFRLIQRELLRNFQTVSDARLLQAVREEYRVRIAQLCLFLSQPGVYENRLRQTNNDPNIERMQELFKYKITIHPAGLSKEIPLLDEVRAPLTPMEMWDIFKRRRSKFDIALVPIPVDKFLDKIPEPSDGELQVFFDDHKKTPHDPSSPEPGFMIPAQVKVEWVMADPESAFYQTMAKTVTTFQALPAIGWSPAYPQLVAACRYGAGPLAFRTYLAGAYDQEKKELRRGESPLGFAISRYAAPPLTEPSLPALLSHLSKPTPRSVASMIASAGTDAAWIAAPASYRARQYRTHAKELEALVAAEDEGRLKFFAPLPGLAATSFPVTPLVALLHADRSERFLPLGAVEAELKKQRETKLARDQVDSNMQNAKAELEEKSGKAVALNLTLKNLIPKYGLQHGETKGFYDPFTISKAPELAPLRELFDKYRDLVNSAEGRGGKEERLKEGDFPRLFFDSAEPVSAASGRYIPRPWPPVVEVKSDNPNTPPKTVSFFEKAEKPVLFWKTADLDSRTPENLKEVRAKVVRAWKMKKAREKYAVAEARRIALQLQKSAPGTYGSVVREQAAKLNVTPKYVNDVAELVPAMADFTTTYHPYTPPKDEIEYARADLAKQLLTLAELGKADKALETSYPELDTLNTELLKGKAVQQIQVLTDKPLNTFYVAVVTQARDATMLEFAEVLRATHARDRLPDLFLEIAQEDAGRAFRQGLITQLRDEMNRSIEADSETIKSFDANVN